MSTESPKLINENDYKKVLERALAAEAKLEAEKKEKQGIQKELSRHKKEKGVESEPKAEIKSNSEAPHEDNSHVWSPTMQACPTCGDVNPDFKDETECSDCGAPLGAEKSIRTVHACPGCGKSDIVGAKGYDQEWKAKAKRH